MARPAVTDPQVEAARPLQEAAHLTEAPVDVGAQVAECQEAVPQTGMVMVTVPP